MVELLNYQEVMETESMLKKIVIASHSSFADCKKLSEINLINEIPLLARGMAYPFRYDRGNKVFFLEVITILKRRFFLACYNCQFLQFPQVVFVEQLQLTREAENLVLASESDGFSIKFTSIELYSEAEFTSYVYERYKRFSDREISGIRKSILSVSEL
ncbi:MAG: hypothetical protein HC895_16750 [Leptolyngbyaceae cyanobacterium SM1_3_5]|nr:hypothetical protein [Leptolyngbyaceae cyanobacterium SM1_3_5]